MWMELQEKKATHDFLSLYSKDPAFPLSDPRPPQAQGFFLKTHDFLRPLERGCEKGGGEAAAAGGSRAAEEHVLPGGVGTYSISHVAGFGGLAPVKHERGTCAMVHAERKPEPGGACAARGGFALWDDSGARDAASRGPRPSPTSAAARTSASSSFVSLSSTRNRKTAAADHKRPMDSVSNAGRGFHDDDEEEDDGFGKPESSAPGKVDMTVKVDGRGDDQKPVTPRSKHSATEQRRRSKINDRFQILRDLIPHSDQKRDKASFLLEVIEYIRFLQEKVQKYESSYPAWNQETAKLTPWRNSQGPGAGMRDPSQAIKNGTSAQGYMYPGNESSGPVVATMFPNAQNPTDFDICAGDPYKSMETVPSFLSKGAAMPTPMQENFYASTGREESFTQQQTLLADSDNLASESQAQWLRSSCPADCTANTMTNEHEELTVDEGTISMSSIYSQGLLTSLSQALQSSGIDLSQASISVQINLGKRANRRPNITTPMGSDKDHDDPSSGNRVIGHSRVGNNGEESEQAPKRHKLDSS